ncbi:Uncharacterized protein FWK35_00008027 [Aphis craccivora]|uniref:Uncharacterized protein n=1 Tax=Aphis craccivora TaxID=307492 RepID=A0A6G0YM92_APHCR|nr:Uncharacterized protein FWK35_00008027 [Aphis craccivora]
MAMVVIKVKQEIKNKALSIEVFMIRTIKEIVIDGEWALLGNNRLLLKDNGPEASERIIIFGICNR